MSLLQDVLKANLEDIERLKNGQTNGNRRSSSEEKDDSDDDLVNVVSQFFVCLAKFFDQGQFTGFSPHITNADKSIFTCQGFFFTSS